jgi:hypothetical protein
MFWEIVAGLLDTICIHIDSYISGWGNVFGQLSNVASPVKDVSL